MLVVITLRLPILLDARIPRGGPGGWLGSDGRGVSLAMVTTTPAICPQRGATGVYSTDWGQVTDDATTTDAGTLTAT